MKTLSILIPEYNCECVSLVKALCLQPGLTALEQWEVIVADDGSVNQDTVRTNQVINSMDRCRFMRLEQNVGRAAIRNYLVREARYDYLLFIDADMSIIDDEFINRYISSVADVVYGSYKVIGCHPGNLRYEYEKHSESSHRAVERQKSQYQDFHTSNYLIKRSIALRHAFDTSFTGYGYEDVAYGRQLYHAGIKIRHIDNPVGFHDFETNEGYLAKTEESLKTLYDHRDMLYDYSRIIRCADMIRRIHLDNLCSWLFRCGKRRMRRRLLSKPSLWMFSFYKVGFYLSQSTPCRQQ